MLCCQSRLYSFFGYRCWGETSCYQAWLRLTWLRTPPKFCAVLPRGRGRRLGLRICAQLAALSCTGYDVMEKRRKAFLTPALVYWKSRGQQVLADKRPLLFKARPPMP